MKVCPHFELVRLILWNGLNGRFYLVLQNVYIIIKMNENVYHFIIFFRNSCIVWCFEFKIKCEDLLYLCYIVLISHSIIDVYAVKVRWNPPFKNIWFCTTLKIRGYFVVTGCEIKFKTFIQLKFFYSSLWTYTFSMKIMA